MTAYKTWQARQNERIIQAWPPPWAPPWLAHRPVNEIRAQLRVALDYNSIADTPLTPELLELREIWRAQSKRLFAKFTSVGRRLMDARAQFTEEDFWKHVATWGMQREDVELAMRAAMEAS